MDPDDFEDLERENRAYMVVVAVIGLWCLTVAFLIGFGIHQAIKYFFF